MSTPGRAAIPVLALLAGWALGPGAPGVRAETEACIECHRDPATLGVEDPGGRLIVDPAIHTASAHGRLECTACHAGFDPYSIPHAAELAPVACGACHAAAATAFAGGAHGRANRRGLARAPACTDCHPPHAVPAPGAQPPAVRRAAQHALCAACHLAQNESGLTRSGDRPGFVQAYVESVHGRTDPHQAPPATCIDCHGAHQVGTRADPQSPLGRGRSAATCGACHPQALGDYAGSIHAAAMEAGDTDSATCTDCHGEHNILPASDPDSRIHPARLAREACGVCHGSVELAQQRGLAPARLESYERSYHGLAVIGGSVRAANCASCHGHHLVLPSSDPASSVHPANLRATCGHCHENATARFTRIPVHAEGTRGLHPLARAFRRGYLALIVVLIGGMLAHNLVVYSFYVRLKWRHHRSQPGYRRYDRLQVFQHALLTLTFTALAISGFALKFPEAGWAQTLQELGLHEEVRRLVHRAAAVGLILSSILQISYFVLSRRGRRDVVALRPSLSDLAELRLNLLYHLGRRAGPPRFDRYDYTEKAEYLALIWGTTVMAITGFVLWFPEMVSAWMPWWTFNVAEVIHYYEAWLATLAILVWHFFFVIYHPREYPLSTVFLDGRMTFEEWRQRHPLEYERETGRPAEPPLDVDIEPGPPPPK